MASKSSAAENSLMPPLRFFSFFSFELRSLFMTIMRHSLSKFVCKSTLYSLSFWN